jgi:endonuclease/exonuclease/phosphatase family metal-dependent hydrolase
MGGVAPSCFQTVIVNTGCSAACFEFLPDLETHPECVAANSVLNGALRTAGWTDLQHDLATIASNNPHLLTLAQRRVEVLSTSHAQLFEALPIMDLKGDKDKTRPRVSPFSSAATQVRGIPLVEAICGAAMDLSNFHAFCETVHQTTTVATEDTTTVDLLLYDLVCARAVFTHISAYRTLFEHSPFYMDGGQFKPSEVSYDELAMGIELQQDATAILVFAEAIPQEHIERLFPAATSWTERTTADPLNPLAIRGVGCVSFGANCTSAFRSAISSICPSSTTTWVERMLAVQIRIGSPGLATIVIAVHWHHSDNLHEYISCISALLHRAVAVWGADLAIVAGDFNFATTEEANFVQRGVAASHGITAHPTTSAGEACVTTQKRRSNFQTQLKKANVLVNAPRIMEFRLAASHLNLATSGRTVSGASPLTPNPTWSWDHAAVVNVTVIPVE